MSDGHPFSAATLRVYAITMMFYLIIYMVLMLVPFYAASIGLDASSIGVVMGVTMLASMVARPLAGTAVDRWGTASMMLLALATFAISLPGYFFPGFCMFVVLRLIQGVVAGTFSTSMEVATIHLVADRLRGQGLSLYSLATMLPATFGPVLALWLKDGLSMESIFGGLSLLGALTLLCAIPLARHLHKHQERQRVETVRGNWRQPELIWASTIMLLVSTTNGAIFTFLPLHLHSRNIGHAATYFLAQTSVLALCRLVGRHWIPSDEQRPFALVGALCLLSAIGAGVLADAESLPPLLLAAVLNGVAFALLYPTLLTYVSFVAPQKSRAFLLSLFIAAADFGFALGALVMGPFANAFSYQAMFMACAAASLLATVGAWRYQGSKVSVHNNINEEKI